MTPEYRAGRAWRIVRVCLCLISMGFVYPSALIDVEEERRAAISKVEKQ